MAEEAFALRMVERFVCSPAPVCPGRGQGFPFAGLTCEPASRMGGWPCPNTWLGNARRPAQHCLPADPNPQLLPVGNTGLQRYRPGV
eukprot:scaffold442_cov397-Prasinococcus_capsulatus_cf.AAC.6